MKKIILTLIFFFIISSGLVHAQSRYHNCGMQGNAQSKRIKNLNKLKNRYNLPDDADFDNSVTLSTILQPGIDTSRFTSAIAVTIEGYIFNVKSGGSETCNCTTKVERYKDIHIEIVPDENNTAENKRVIVELTPRLKRMIFDQLGIHSITTLNLKHAILNKRVRIKGWLFFDEEHLQNAYNTDPDDTANDNWRATCWEIHPITSIEILE